MNPAKSTNPEQAKTVKWVLFCIYLSLAIVFALLGIIVPEHEEFLQLPVLYYFSAVAGLSFLGARFKKSAGIVIMMGVLFYSFLFLSYLSFWDCGSGRKEIIQFRLVRSNGSSNQLVVYEKDKTHFYPLDTTTISSEVDTITISSFYLFGTKHILYQFKGFILSGNESREQGGERAAADFSDVNDNQWFTLLHSLITKLPGITAETDYGKIFSPVPLQKYALVINNDKNFSVEPVNE